MQALFDVIQVRDMLKRELGAGFYDALAWSALYIMARDADCLAIADQVQGYIREYGRTA
jgi:hypothetical protein